MIITGFRTLVLGTPWRNLTYIILETDEGLPGVGAARVLGKTHTVTEYLKDAQRHFVGHSPFDVEALFRRMTLLDFGKAGEVVHTGIALVELACWDIIGKACGQPVYNLLGGKVRDTVPAYANGWYTVERSPAEFAAASSRATPPNSEKMGANPRRLMPMTASSGATRAAINAMVAPSRTKTPNICEALAPLLLSSATSLRCCSTNMDARVAT